jgi:hypothetical protein
MKDDDERQRIIQILYDDYGELAQQNRSEQDGILQSIN